MNDRRSDHELDMMVSFASEPPPGDSMDVHGARTAVAALPDSFFDDLRRGKGKEEDPTTSRYKVLPDTLLVEAVPTVPPPAVRSTPAHVRELNAAISAALTVAMPRFDPPAEALPPSPARTVPPAEPVIEVDLEELSDLVHPLPVTPMRNEERWVMIVLAVAIVVALLAARSGIAIF